jgi:Ca2+-binding RTX toxin-like protein
MPKSFVGGSNILNDDLPADYGNVDGTIISGNGGNDTLRGGNYNDILTGGQGDDHSFGGAGADVFQWHGKDIINLGGVPTGVETDYVYDVNFAEGDLLHFNGFAENRANGTMDGYRDIVRLVNRSHWEASKVDGNNNLVLSYDFGDGSVQNIVLTAATGSAVARYIAQGGTFAQDDAWGGDNGGAQMGILNL